MGTHVADIGRRAEQAEEDPLLEGWMTRACLAAATARSFPLTAQGAHPYCPQRDPAPSGEYVQWSAPG